jgi:hypothetical protein
MCAPQRSAKFASDLLGGTHIFGLFQTISTFCEPDLGSAWR